MSKLINPVLMTVSLPKAYCGNVTARLGSIKNFRVWITSFARKQDNNNVSLIIPTFHWTAFSLRSWRSQSFSKIVSNRDRSVDSHTIWGLHASTRVSQK